MSFNISNKLIFINSFQFLRSSLVSIVKSLDKVDCKYLSREFNSKVLNLFKQKRFYRNAYESRFQKLTEKFLRKESFIVCRRVKKIAIKSITMFLRFDLDSN